MKVRSFFDVADLYRTDKFISVRFRTPFRVISTSSVEGGVRDGVEIVFNHQACEPRRHDLPSLVALYRRADRYAAELLRRHGLADRRAAGLGTAANMNNLCVAEAACRELRVAALATAGVETNAARAGDPASYYEHDGTFELHGSIGPAEQGTINVIVLVNQPLEPGALVRAVMTATEAKVAVLQELSVASRQSGGLATGTGTDQIAIAAPVEGGVPLTTAGHHSALGELIGRTVHDAVRDALAF